MLAHENWWLKFQELGIVQAKQLLNTAIIQIKLYKLASKLY